MSSSQFRLAVCLLFPILLQAAEPASTSTLEWRKQREAELLRDNGWLSLAGLYWLKQGSNTFGSGSTNSFTLPATAPAQLGSFEFDGSSVILKPASGSTLSVNGKQPSAEPLRTDSEGKPDIVQSGDLTFIVIRRGNRWGIRLKDKNSEARRNFHGLNWYPVNPAYEIHAQYTAYPEPHKVQFDSQIGEPAEMVVPGFVTFRLDGREVRLEPVLEDDNLSFIFKDATTGKETYGAGRFLDTSLPVNGLVTLDFNRAYNPPCAFTPYATCPLPPRQNRLAVPIPAGEKNYHE